MLKTSQTEKAALDEQVARFIFATNTAFSAVEHPEFIKLVELLRPGYSPPNRHDVGGRLLDKVQQSLMDDCKEKLQEKTVSMCLDGWSNVHNEPIVCVAVTTPDGDSYVTDTVDTSGNSHTADYLTDLARDAIDKCEEKFGCRVGSLVTDNAANMSKTRSQLAKDSGHDIITHGCSAHLFNLLAHDVEIKGVKEHVVHIVKYFRNVHLPAAWYKAAGGKCLVLPQDVRWNTLADCLQSYLDNWPTLLKVCEEHRGNIDSTVASKVQNISIKRNAEDYLKRLKPISVALDKVQRDTCFIGGAVEAWKQLGTDWDESEQPLSAMKKLEERRSQALTPAHFLADILDPQSAGKSLSPKEVDAAMDFVASNYPSLLPILVNYQAKAKPFMDYMFTPTLVNSVAPLAWWKSLSERLDDKALSIIYKILGASASSAGIERVFSTFGFIHSKIRNRLGTEKAGKLVFVFKLLNSKKHN